jgi:hypothetical protein
MAAELSPLIARDVILEMCSEDEFGLYEVVWSLNTAYPTVPKGDKVTASRTAMRRLLDEERVVLLRARWASNGRVPVALNEARGLIESDSAWEPPNEDTGEYLCFSSMAEAE